MRDNITGKVVVITGASSGLGAATARHLAEQGARLVLGARRLERLKSLAWDINLPPNAVVRTDVTNPDQVQNLINTAINLHGRIDVLINNAGIMPHSLLEQARLDDWNRAIDINLKGVLHGIAAAIEPMKQQKSGHIINVSSIAGHKVRPGSAVYAATKAAVLMLSEGLRQEVKAYNIRTTVLSPGAVQSELPQSVTDPNMASAIADFYENYAIPADSFARAVAFAINQPDDVDINEIQFRPTRQDF